MVGVLRILAVVLAVSGMSALGVPPQACACSCVQPESPEEEVAGYDAVFVGAVVDERRVDDLRIYEFEVSSVYTGDVASRTTVSTNAEGPACGASFDQGVETTVLANATPGAAAEFTTNSCSRMRLADSAVLDEVYGPPSVPTRAPETTERRAEAASDGGDGRGGGTTVSFGWLGIALGIVVAVGGVTGLLMWRVKRAR